MNNTTPSSNFGNERHFTMFTDSDGIEFFNRAMMMYASTITPVKNEYIHYTDIYTEPVFLPEDKEEQIWFKQNDENIINL
jgi:hypothetical protein